MTGTTTRVLSGRVGKPGGTVVRVTGTPARMRAFTSGKPSYALRQTMMRHQHAAVTEATRVTRDRIREKTPTRSRRTLYSIVDRVWRLGTIVFGKVSSDHPNVGRLERGTGVHGPSGMPIHAKHARMMRFPNRAGGGFRLTDAPRQRGGGIDPRARWVFARSIRGQPAHHMFREGFREAKVLARRIFAQHGHEAMREVKARGLL